MCALEFCGHTLWGIACLMCNVNGDVHERIAAEYAQSYLKLMNEEQNKYITNGSKDNGRLESSLREHELFGRILGNIEHVEWCTGENQIVSVCITQII